MLRKLLPSFIPTAVLLTFAVACRPGGTDTGAYLYTMPSAFTVYVDSLPDGSIRVYALPEAHVKLGLTNIKLPVTMAITSWPASERGVHLKMDRAGMRQEPGVRLRAAGTDALCGQMRPSKGRFYQLTFMGSFRDAKIQDPKARSFDIYQEAPLDSLPVAPRDVRDRLTPMCR